MDLQTSAASRCTAATAVLLGLVLLIGCDGGLRFAPVSGVVRLDGAPLASANISFMQETMADGSPVTGRASVATGKTGEDGRFSLQTLSPDKRMVEGAAVGKHRVTIYSKIVETDSRGEDQVIRDELLPAKFNRNSELTIEVLPGGTTECNFDLDSE